MLTFPDPEPYTSHQLWKVATSEVATYYRDLWHSQLHLSTITSNEQSLLPLHCSATGHSPGQSECLPFLQKYVTSIN